MASLKNFKFKVNSLCDNLLNECYAEMIFGTSNEIDEVWSIILKCEKLKSEINHQINSKEPKSLGKAERKKYYKSMEEKFYNATAELIDELNHVIP